MAQLAIKGHKTRGKEVIEILEMLGGVNRYHRKGNVISLYYYIGSTTHIYSTNEILPTEYFVFTLEEFLEKFPYKVGDKVQRSGATSCGSIYVIEYMKWKDNQVEYVICDLYWKNCKCTVMSKDLQPYKEETMEEIKIDIPKGYEFAGVDDNNQQVVFTKIQPQYPKTYEECCKVVNASPYVELVYNVSDGQKYSYDIDNLQIYENIRRLKICRDAYWKIAGEEMGWGKLWKPDYIEGVANTYYTIYVFNNKLFRAGTSHRSVILAFPTEKIRDAFYENFKDLIEQCKELL